MSLIYLPKSGGAKLIPSKQVATSAWANVRVVLHNPLKVVCAAMVSFSHSPGPLHWPPPQQGYPTALCPSSQRTNGTQGASLLHGLH